ncbi:MAG: glucose 1-dehydrogenase [Gammaproteobacteria bacterium]|nr:glucose 1-dehydrogenase [Gammaproteobacteria bacterium]MBI5615320.1 glucose 1-dehydrogenase [Gammaproteobacteria bacterium]
MRLKDKICIVTGAAQGFGAAIARRFAAEGAKVLVSDLNGEGAAKVAALIGPDAEPFAADVSKGMDFSAMAARCVAVFGGLDVVVNNAGTTHRNQPMLDVTEAVYDRLMAVNVKSIFHSAHACVPVFRRQGHGCMLNIASTGGIRPRPGLTWYNASKGAVITMTKSMAVELAPDRIRVNALCPVAAETALLEDFMGEDSPEMRAKFVSTIPLGRFCTPDDVAKAALHLCSDDADFLTGVCLEVDGGRTI